MRRIERETITNETTRALQGFQEEIDAILDSGELDPVNHWQGKRRSQPILAVLAALKRMAGNRERCMYCVDSQGSDIEHYWPKSAHPRRMYLWANLLLACAQCGRFKGMQFPLSSDGLPLLIDPSAEDPWAFLDFDPTTGNISARYIISEERYSEKGDATVRLLHLDRREGVSVGYRKTYNRICHLVVVWADDHLPADYVSELREADDHGLLGWFLRGSGRNDPPFLRFRERHGAAWAVCQERLL